MLSPAESHDRFSRVASTPTAIVSLNSSHTWDFCFSYCLSCFPLSLLLYTHHLQGEPCYRVWLLGHRLSPLWQGKCVVWSWEISVRYIWVHTSHTPGSGNSFVERSWIVPGLCLDLPWGSGTVRWGFCRWMTGLFSWTFGSGNGFWLLFVLMLPLTVQTTQPSWIYWVEGWSVLFNYPSGSL